MYTNAMMNERLKALGVVYFNTVDSTNLTAKQFACQGAPHGTLILAEQQTTGRGRRGRTWLSRPGCGVWMSLIARGFAPEKAGELPLVTAIAVCRAIGDLCFETPQIKWPNDIVLHGKKLCGMLLEMGQGFAVIGAGINVLGRDFPDELPNAGSIQSTTGRAIERAALVEAFLMRFEESYKAWLERGFFPLLPDYRALSCTLGREVRAFCPDGEYVGVALDVSPDGALLLRLSDGILKTLYAGDVSVRGLFDYV